jgi:hypothetical protein
MSRALRTLRALCEKPFALGLLVPLVLAFTTLITPTAPPLVKAQGAGAGVEGEGVLERGSLYVYKDSSASLELHMAEKLKQPLGEKWVFNASLEVEPTNTVTLTLNSLTKRLTLYPEELESGEPGLINYYKMSYEWTIKGKVGNVTSIAFRLRMYNEADEASLLTLVVDERAIGPAAVWEGTIAYTFSGAFVKEFKEALEKIDLTNETIAKYFVKGHFFSHITGWGNAISGVEILNTTKTENHIRVDYSILIDKEKAVEGLKDFFRAYEPVALFDKLFEPSTSPITFTLTAFHNATVYDFRGSLKSPREGLWRALVLAYIFTDMFWRYAHAVPFHTLNPWQFFGVLCFTAQGFEVKSGGELRASLDKVEEIPSYALLKVDLKTPRILKRGATTPSENLKILSNRTAELLSAVFLPSIIPPAPTNATLTLFPEEGVKVRLDGAEVKEVIFKDISSLKVTLATALTVSAEPSAIDAGREVVVKGKIEPAMSIPITITLRGPDGSLKTIDTTTSEDGSLSVPVKLKKVGSYTITASYAGSDLYEPSSSEVMVEAKAPPLLVGIPGALWYLVAIVVIVVGAVVALMKAPRNARRP